MLGGFVLTPYFQSTFLGSLFAYFTDDYKSCSNAHKIHTKNPKIFIHGSIMRQTTRTKKNCLRVEHPLFYIFVKHKTTTNGDKQKKT